MTARPRVTGTSPSFIVSDLPRSVDFYDRLGFGDASIWGDPPSFAMLHRGGFEIMLNLAEDDSTPHPNGPTGVWDLYVRITDVDAEITALQAAGVAIVRGPVTEFYKMREIDVLDPDGHRICFAQNCGVT